MIEANIIPKRNNNNNKVVFMRSYNISLLALLVSVIALSVAIAKDTTASSETTQMEADQNAKVIRFFIDGEESMRLDADGLHVKRDLIYGKSLIDAGTENYPGSTPGGADAQ